MLLCAFQHTATSAYLVEIGVIGSIGCIRAPSDFAVTPRISCVGVMATDAYIFFNLRNWSTICTNYISGIVLDPIFWSGCKFGSVIRCCAIQGSCIVPIIRQCVFLGFNINRSRICLVTGRCVIIPGVIIPGICVISVLGISRTGGNRKYGYHRYNSHQQR